MTFLLNTNFSVIIWDVKEAGRKINGIKNAFQQEAFHSQFTGTVMDTGVGWAGVGRRGRGGAPPPVNRQTENITFPHTTVCGR